MENLESEKDSWSAATLLRYLTYISYITYDSMLDWVLSAQKDLSKSVKKYSLYIFTISDKNVFQLNKLETKASCIKEVLDDFYKNFSLSTFVVLGFDVSETECKIYIGDSNSNLNIKDTYLKFNKTEKRIIQNE